ANAEYDDAIDLRLEALGRLENSAYVALVSLAAILFDQLPWQVDEGAVERQHLGRRIRHLPFGPDLLADLHELLLDRLDSLRAQIILRLQLRERSPCVRMR